MATDPRNTDEGYFNDLSRQPTMSNSDSLSPQDQAETCENGDAEEIPKTKRIACVICRKRKLKCDGNRPKCSTCARLGHNCAYDEVRRKSGPKRGYVKELEARLAQVEAQVKDGPKKSKTNSGKAIPSTQATSKQNGFQQESIPEDSEPMDIQTGTRYSTIDGPFNTMASNDPFTMPAMGMAPDMNPDLLNIPDMGLGLDENFSWEMIGLGLEEPMPTQEAIDELTNIYFEKVHQSLPMLHKYRFQASMSLSPQSRPPICLRYIMWCHAAAITDKYMHHQDIFYRRARKYIELDEMKGSGEAFVSVTHAQTWVLVCAYEFKMMYFPRAWMSVGRAARMVLMMGLNRVDGLGLDVKQCLPPPRDWTEREERRRTFWMAYCVDRYASIGTGWPMSIDERDIKSNLPSSEENYENSTPQKTPPLHEAMTHEQVANLSAFAGVVYVSHFFGLNLTHLHRPEPNDGEDDLQGQFWKRHRKMDNILLNTSLSLPSHLRLPAGVRNPNIVFLNFAIHTSTVCLHQAAIFKAEKNQLPQSVIDQSRTRCILAASEIASVMRLTSHLDVAGMNPFMAFCLYVAARVFVQYLKKSPNDQEVRASLEFLLTAMSALKRKNPLTESFMVQLNLDIEGSGLDILLHNPDFSSLSAIPNDMTFRKRERQDIDRPIPSYCSPVPSGEGWSSEGQSNRSEGDVRLPDWRPGATPGISTIRAESPRQTQYALGNIQLQAMENAGSGRPYFPEGGPQSYGASAQGVFPSEGWNQGFNSNAGPIGMNPIVNNNININAFDTDMTDTSGNLSHSNSAGLTPQSSNTYHSTSNPTYSPPQVEDESGTVQVPMHKKELDSRNHYAPFTAPGDNMFADKNGLNANAAKSTDSTTNASQDDPFKVPPGWDVSTGMTPGFTGMTPDGGWEKMMQEGGWDQMMKDGTAFNQRTGMTPQNE